jgi:hypothetical protein
MFVLSAARTLLYSFSRVFTSLRINAGWYCCFPAPGRPVCLVALPRIVAFAVLTIYPVILDCAAEYHNLEARYTRAGLRSAGIIMFAGYWVKR